jgi:mono/diheme cytochrome c family protein
MWKVLVLSVLIAVVLCPLCLTADRKPTEEKGRVYFRDTCKNCHTRGALGGEITPLSKGSEQWRAYFSRGRHAIGQGPLTGIMSAEQLRDVEKYLVAHAADSLQPETCGR